MGLDFLKIKIMLVLKGLKSSKAYVILITTTIIYNKTSAVLENLKLFYIVERYHFQNLMTPNTTNGLETVFKCK